jgi:ABC-type phosphate transport system auxiliary subunit
MDKISIVDGEVQIEKTVIVKERTNIKAINERLACIRADKANYQLAIQAANNEIDKLVALKKELKDKFNMEDEA